jgi:hypothetical protein
MPPSGSVVVKVDSLDGPSEWTKVGLQVRERLGETSRYANLAVSREHGVEFQFRTARMGNTTSTLTNASVPCWLKLTWSPVQLPVHTSMAKNNLQTGQRIEVLGLLHWNEANAALNDAMWRPVQTTAAEGQDDLNGLTDASALTAIGELRQMPLEQAARAYPVRLRGVVMYAQPGLLALRDSGAGIWMVGGQALAPARAGDFVQVEGASRAGAVSPEVEVKSLQVLGPGALPQSSVTSLEALLANRQDSEWVEMRGIAHEVRSNSILLNVEGGILEAVLPNELDAAKRDLLAGSLLQVRGVVRLSPEKNVPRLSQAVLYVPSMKLITIEQQPPANRFEAPPKTVAELARAAALEPNFASVCGTVTYSERDAMFIQDLTGGLQLLCAVPQRLPPGTKVLASGFSALEDDMPLLKEAVLRPENQRSDVAPVVIPEAGLPTAGYLVGAVTGWRRPPAPTPHGQLHLRSRAARRLAAASL